jgi:hypothetical protein
LQAFKLVRLGVCIEREKHEQTKDLRKNGLWYPHVPPEHLNLNQSTFTSSPHSFSSYQPLFWVRFGTSEVEASRLSKVTIRGRRFVRGTLPQQISVTWTDDCSIEQTSDLGNSSGQSEEEMAVDWEAGEVIEKLETTNITLAKQLGRDDFDHSCHLLALDQVKSIRVS